MTPDPMSGGPDFLGVGVQKCGTTWTGYVLDQHPGVLCHRHEVDFFERNFHRGYGWYHHHFEDRGDRVAGEISPNYLFCPRPQAARKQFYPRWFPRWWLRFWQRRSCARTEIARHYPGIRLYAMFRNPVDRAWSHYWMWRNRKERIGKGRQVRTFRQMFEDDGRWIRTQGHYHTLIAPWLESFPEMGLFIHDDLKSDPLGLARKLYRFLGVLDTFEPEFEKRVNAGSYEPMPAEERAWVADHYRDEIARFSEVAGRDLTHWTRRP